MTTAVVLASSIDMKKLSIDDSLQFKLKFALVFLSYFGINVSFSARFFEKEDVTGVEHLKSKQKCSIILRPAIAKGDGRVHSIPRFWQIY